VKYDITQTGLRAFRVGVARDGSDTDLGIGDFTTLREAQLFISRMQVFDAGASHGGSGERLERQSPAALRNLSRVLVAHAKAVRAEAEKARERALRSRLHSEQALRSCVTHRAFSDAAARRRG
jgi:hypothetical protein